MSKAVVCDRKGEVIGDLKPGKLSVTLVNPEGVELVKVVDLDLCGPCTDMSYKIISEKLLLKFLGKELEAKVEKKAGGDI